MNDEAERENYKVVEIKARIMSGNEDGSGNLTNKQLSLMIADVVGYSELEPFQYKAFFSRVLPNIAEKLAENGPKAKNSWGDGIIAIFEDPESAARAALDIRDYFRNNQWGETPLPEMEIRIALHIGIVYEGTNPLRSEEDVVGTNVNLTARVEPIVSPNHIFTTEIFRTNLETRARHNNFEFDELFEQELAKGWGKEKLHHLRWEGDSSISPDDIPDSSHEELDPQREVRALDSFLDGGDFRNKKQTVDILVQRGSLEAIDALIERLLDREQTRGDVRQRIAGKLDEINDKRVIKPLMEAIEEDPQMSVANNAIASINNLADNGVVGNEVIGTFESVITDDEHYPDRLRVQAAYVLGNITDRAAVQPLVDILNNRDKNMPELRHAAAESLSGFNDVRARKALQEALNDPSPSVRGAAISGLGNFSSKKAAVAISERLLDQEGEVDDIRGLSAKTLREFNIREVVDPLIEALEDPSIDVRVSSVLSLGEMGAVDARPHLEELLLDSSESPRVRAASANALGELALVQSIDTLVEATDDPNFDVKYRAVSSLSKIDSQRSLEEIINILTNEERMPEVRDVAALSLQRLGKRDAVDPLIQTADSQIVELQRSSIQALCAIDTPRAIDKVTSIYNDPDQYDAIVRAHAATSLKRSNGNHNVVETLIERLQEESNDSVVKETIDTLGILDSGEATDAIETWATSKSASIPIRRSALFALALIADPSAEDAITDVAKDRSEPWRVRKLALPALGALGTESADETIRKLSEDTDEAMRVNIAARQWHEMRPRQIRDHLEERRDRMLEEVEVDL